LTAAGEDLCYILVEALDEKGTLCSLANSLIRFDVEGLADIAAVGNGNHFRSNHFRLTAESCFTAR